MRVPNYRTPYTDYTVVLEVELPPEHPLYPHKEKIVIEKISTPRKYSKDRPPQNWEVYIITRDGNVRNIFGIAWRIEGKEAFRFNVRCNEALLYPQNEKERAVLLEAFDYIEGLDEFYRDLLMGKIERERPIETTTSSLNQYHNIRHPQEYYERIRGKKTSEYREIAGTNPSVWVSPEIIKKIVYHVIEDKKKTLKGGDVGPVTLDRVTNAYKPVLRIDTLSQDPYLEDVTQKLKTLLKETIVEELGEWTLNPDVEKEIGEFVDILGERIEPLAPQKRERRKAGTIQAKLALDYED